MCVWFYFMVVVMNVEGVYPHKFWDINLLNCGNMF